MKNFLILFIFICATTKVCAQFPYGTTGLLHMPTADMQRDKTFMTGGSLLGQEATPDAWNYKTWNYYVNITFFPWMEVGYTCTLLRMNSPELGINNEFTNQDRNFSLRLRLWKEGWWNQWTPQIVIGSNDPITTAFEGNGVGETGNGYWNRYYLAATKHIPFLGIGDLGLHASYVYNKRKEYHLNGPAFGANFRFALPETSIVYKAINGLDLRAEYDSRTINIGGQYSFWKDYINTVVELNQCKYLSGGLVFKVHLK